MLGPVSWRQLWPPFALNSLRNLRTGEGPGKRGFENNVIFAGNNRIFGMTPNLLHLNIKLIYSIAE